MKEKFFLEDESGDRGYFTIIPNYIANHSTANDQALYFQMKKHAGEKGECFVSEKTLKSKLHIGGKALKKSLAYLISHNWIREKGIKEVVTKGGVQTVKSYSIVDIWKLNSNHYKGVSESEHLTTKGVSESNQRGALLSNKEEPILNKKEIVAEATTFNFEEKIAKMRVDTNKHIQVIAFYWEYKNWKFNNKEQYDSSLKRELRAARNLVGYKFSEISQAMKYCEDNYKEFGWSLETVHKRITNLINKK